MFKNEPNNSLLIFTADKREYHEDDAAEVEKDFRALDHSRFHDAIIDLNGVVFISSHFANWIMQVHMETQRKGGQLVICSLNERILDMLGRLHFTSMIVVAYDQLVAKWLLIYKEQTAPTA